MKCGLCGAGMTDVGTCPACWTAVDCEELLRELALEVALGGLEVEAALGVASDAAQRDLAAGERETFLGFVADALQQIEASL